MTWLIVFGLVIVAAFGLTVLRGAPYVPSKRRDVALAFDELYNLGGDDVLVDIGSGDGMILRMAAERGAQAVGLEINPILVLISRLLSRGEKRITIRLADFWLTAFPETTTIVYTFGESRDITRMYHKVQREASRLRRPLWFMSYGFTVSNIKTTRHHGAHHLYEVLPLQEVEA